MKSWLLTKDHKIVNIGSLFYLRHHNVVFLLLSRRGIFATTIRLKPADAQRRPGVAADLQHAVQPRSESSWSSCSRDPLGFPRRWAILLVPAHDRLQVTLASPKLNLLSLCILVAGGLFVLYAMLVGGVDTGWTLYVPFSTRSRHAKHVRRFLTAVVHFHHRVFRPFLISRPEFHHVLRYTGCALRDSCGSDLPPSFIWSIYATSVIQVLARRLLSQQTHVVGSRSSARSTWASSIHAWAAIRCCSSTCSGSIRTRRSHIMILPSMGVISELVTSSSRKRIFGYRLIAVSSLAIAVVGFLAWGHHMYVAGESVYAGMMFSFLSFIVAIPSAIKVFNWTATLYKGSISWNARPCT